MSKSHEQPEDLPEKVSPSFLATVCCLFFQGAQQDTFLMLRSLDGQEVGKGDLPSVMLEEIQDHASLFSERAALLQAQRPRHQKGYSQQSWGHPSALAGSGGCRYSPGVHRHAPTPAGTHTLSFRLICNSFSLHKVLDQKNCLYIENFWNSLSSICCIRI